MNSAPIVITGAAGMLGQKLARHWRGRRALRLLDIDPRGEADVHAADLSRRDASWTDHFRGAGAVVHLAANPVAFDPWDRLIASNLDALIHAFAAAAEHRVPRFVFASSNHVMGGYKQDGAAGGPITDQSPPRPGTHYSTEGQSRDSTPYASAKLFGERLGAVHAEVHGLEAVIVRIGWVWKGDNTPRGLPADREDWFRKMWLSDGDFLRLMDCCVDAPLPARCTIIHGMSNNTGMRWDLSSARALGYAPQDDVARS